MRTYSHKPIIGSAGEVTNPADEAVVADTGALDAAAGGGGIYEVAVVVSASAASQFRLERRDAANGAVVGTSLGFYVAAGGNIVFDVLREALRGERFRIVMDDAQGAGTVYANITATRVN